MDLVLTLIMIISVCSFGSTSSVDRRIFPHLFHNSHCIVFAILFIIYCVSMCYLVSSSKIWDLTRSFYTMCCDERLHCLSIDSASVGLRFVKTQWLCFMTFVLTSCSSPARFTLCFLWYFKVFFFLSKNVKTQSFSLK